MASSASRHVLQLTTNPDDHVKIYRVQIGDTVYLSKSCEVGDIDLGISCKDPTDRHVPLNSDSDISPERVYEYDNGSFGVLTSCSFVVNIAGPYNISYKSPVNDEDICITVLADPVITCFETDDITHQCGNGMNIDRIAVQTHLTKCCGSVDEWEEVFEVTKESGYNMVHLTPIQELGISESSYSLHSHLKLSKSLKLGKGAHRYESELQIFEEKLQKLHKNTGLFFITDIVWNHVSICNSDINEHPYSYYNLYNTPNLIPAYLIDRNIAQFANKLEYVSEIRDLRSFEERLRNSLCEIQDLLEMIYRIDYFTSNEEDGDIKDADSLDKPSDVIFKLWSVDYRKQKNGGTINFSIFEKWLLDKGFASSQDLTGVVKSEINMFNEVNVPRYVQEIINKVVTAVIGTVKHRFIDSNGLKYDFGTVNLVDRYFHISNTSLSREFELDLYSQANAERIKTCNGWKTGETIKDMSTTMAYTRRELVIWNDSVKLRYGESRDDNPWLWGYMQRYTSDMAKIFHGFRIDNCHNTPLHVGMEMLKCARRVRSNLYVVADLFTGNEEIDARIINSMGITSCIRELSQAQTPRNLSELIYHYGESKPCGSFDMTYQLSSGMVATRLLPSRPHAMLLDQTHDNPCPFDRHPIANVLALAGATSSAKCSIGSNRGYDELVPHHIHVVEEKRRYPSKNGTADEQLKKAKKALLELHQYLESFNETFVDQVSEDVIIVTRHDPVTCDKVLIVIATKWSEVSECCSTFTVSLPGEKTKVLLEIEIDSDNSTYIRHDHFISGLAGVIVNVKEQPLKSSSVSVTTKGDIQEMVLNLSPGCVMALEVSASKPTMLAIANFNKFLDVRHELFDVFYEACSLLTLHDLNHIMYWCHGEEENSGCGGVYNIPGHGNLAYAGIVGFYHVLENIEKTNATGHPLCKNLYEGWWMVDYICNRLKPYKLGTYVEEVFAFVKGVPQYMRPKVFEFVISAIYSTCLRRVGDLIPEFSEKPWFYKQLILTSVQLVGKIGRTGIHALPDTDGSAISMSAGIPHFSHGFMRCWGRDTFIALPGLLISTQRLDDARELIVGFARTLRYGLIPNLLSEEGHKPRYNCRDAVWWWCRAVKLFYEKEPEILSEKVYRLYHPDDSKVPFDSVFDCTVLDVIYEILNRHATGINFREETAGCELDEHMRDEGFLVSAGVDFKTGFVWGGSKSNCGTWMDKLGSSDAAGNRGLPATPRYGSAIEIVGLSYQTVTWMHELFEKGISEIGHVCVGNKSGYTTKIPFTKWSTLIKNNFDTYFWTKADGFYRDTVSVYSPENEEVEEFRPNQAVAMVVAPGLFDPAHHLQALEKMAIELTGPVGMKTLAPSHPNYRPSYHTDNNSNDFHTAHGFNYHQGPEWVWCMGFYLRAKLHYEVKNNVKDIIDFYEKVLAPHRAMVAASPFRGLTELTNRDGDFCAGSCETQAWSSGTILELLTDIENMVGTESSKDEQ